jgi:COP9 signalosome complex subunit 6
MADVADVCSHPLAILNISDHVTRSRHTGHKSKSALSGVDGADQTVVGALLGTQAGRTVAVVNSFELALAQEAVEPAFDLEFFSRRREQCESGLRCVGHELSG